MTKVISLSDSAYDRLKSSKSSEESFSDAVLRLVEGGAQPPLLDLFGKWPGDAKEFESIKKRLREDRKTAKLREVRF